MANGTIAFDTLQTSGQITGTAKSVDTDFVVNGVNKIWVDLDGTGTIAIDDSLNCTSATDNNTGDYTVTFTNSMNSATYSGAAMGANRRVVVFQSRAAGNTNVYSQDHNDGTNEADSDPTCFHICGDLA